MVNAYSSIANMNRQLHAKIPSLSVIVSTLNIIDRVILWTIVRIVTVQSHLADKII